MLFLSYYLCRTQDKRTIQTNTITSGMQTEITSITIYGDHVTSYQETSVGYVKKSTFINIYI